MEIEVRGNKYIIRRATTDDQTQIQKLIFEVLEEYGLLPDPEGVDADLYQIGKAYDGGYFGVITDQKGIILGTYGLYKMSEDRAEIRKMYLDKNYRGLGLGTWMVNFLIEKSRELGFKTLALETASPLKEAISLYEKMGFEEYKHPHQTPRCDKSFSLKL